MKNRPNKSTKTIMIAGITLVTLIVLVTALMLIPVKVDGTLTCNTGFVGLDLEIENVIQNMTCFDAEYDSSLGRLNYTPDRHFENTTCFKENTMLKHIKIKNIDGMNCYGSTNIRMPLIAWLTGLGDGWN